MTTKQLLKPLLTRLSFIFYFLLLCNWNLEAQAPVFTSSNTHTVSYNTSVNFPITTTDPNGNIVSVTAANLPSWLNITGTNYNVTTFAGSSTYGSVDGVGTNASFGVPQGIAIDSNNNIYVVDTQHHKIRKITPAGVVSTFAGNGNQGYSNGTTFASFDRPGGIVIDSQDNIFVADTYNHLIRKITPTGEVSIFAGGFGFNFSGSIDGVGTNAGFLLPGGITIDNDDNLYVTDTNNHKIRKITSAGVVTTIADSSDGLNFPLDIAIDSNNNLYVSESNNHRIQKITSTGVVSVFAGTGSSGATDGVGTSASFYSPYGITIDANDNLYVTEKGNQKIRKITSAGLVTTIAGTGSSGTTDGAGANATFNYPSYLTVDKNGIIYVSNNHSIRKLSPSDPYITGTAVSFGQYVFTLTATDTNYDASNQFFTLIVKNIPTVNTTGATNINVNAVTFNGEVFSDNFDAVTERGFVYSLTSTNPSPELNGSGVTKIVLGTGIGVFTHRAVSLIANSNYSYRAYAINGEGTGYGEVNNSTTLENTLPFFVSENNHSVSINAAISFYVNASDYDENDSNDDPITITSTNLPNWLSFTNNTLTGTAPANVGQHTFTLTVTDSNNGVTNQTFTLTIKDKPEVTTNDATIINANSVTFNGEVHSDNFDAVTERGIVYAESNDNTSPEIGGNATTKVIIGSGTGVFTNRVLNLRTNTNYAYRAYATNGEGTRYGAVKNFTTLVNTPPSIISTNVYDTSVNTAITFDINVTDVNDNAENNDPVTITTSSLPNWLSFTNDPTPTLTGTPTTAQEVAIIITATDSNNGVANQTLTLTIKDKPIVTTTDASNVDANTVTFSGEVITDNFDAVIERGIVYALTSENSSPEVNGSGVSEISVGSGTGVFTTNIINLTPSTGYTYRSYATNGVGTAYGAVKSFTSLANTPPSFTSTNAYLISANAAINFPITTIDINTNDVVTLTAANLPNELALTGVNYNVSTFAGTGSSGNTDATGTNASFNNPSSAVIDSNGNIFIADQANHKIRKITPEGVVTTFAGTGNLGSADGTGTTASFFAPYGIAVDSNNNLYIADQGNHKIRKITPAGVVTTIAGNGSQGFTNGTGTSASFNGPTNIAVDSNGNLYVTDYGNNAIRKITSAGVVSTLAGNGSSGYVNDTGTNARFNSPYDLVVDTNDNIFVADAGNHSIRKITPTGVVTTFAGNEDRGATDGTGRDASFSFPTGIAIDNSNTLYIGDTSNHKIRKITPAAEVTTLAGTGSVGNTDGIGANASFERPSDVAVGSNGILYALERTGQRIRKLQPLDFVLAGAITVAGQNSITFTATDTNNGVTNQNFTLTIKDKPLVATLDVTSINANSVTFNGNVTADNFDAVTERGVVYAVTDDNASPELNGNAVTKVVVGAGTGVFTNRTASLIVNTNYSYRAYATNGEGTTYGAVKNFTTLVNTPPSFTSANTYTTIIDTEISFSVTTTDTNDNANNSDPVTVTASNLPSWLTLIYNPNPTLTGTTPSTAQQHTITLTATDSNNGVTNQTFILTSKDKPTVTTTDASNISANTITIGGEVVTDNFDAVTERGIIYAVTSENASPELNGSAVIKVVIGSGLGTFTSGIQNLTAITDYSYRAYATNGEGTAYGTVKNFTTLANTPPDFTSANTHEISVNTSVNFSITTTDIDNNEVKVVATNLPSWLLLSYDHVVSSFAGSGVGGNTDGTGTNASFLSPQGIAIDSHNNIFVVDSNNNTIRKITPSGVVTTFAGNGSAGNTDGIGTNASFSLPIGIVIDSNDNIFIADVQNPKIRKITPEGVVSTFAGSGVYGDTDGVGGNASFETPVNLAVDSDDNIYVADRSSHKIRKITPSGVVTTFAGSGVYGDTDGVGGNASFETPTDLAVDSDDNIYVADRSSRKIRKITPGGVVTTFAGSGVEGAIDGPGTNAAFHSPTGLGIDSNDNLYVVDQGNHKIRKITPTGDVSTIAGSGSEGAVDDTGANASFRNPYDVAVDNIGNLFITDQGNVKIRKLQFLNPTLGGYASTIGQDAITLTATDTNKGVTNQNFTLTVIDDSMTVTTLPLEIKVFLQGPYEQAEGLMRDDLRTAGVIPTATPYSDGVIVNSSVFDVTGSDAIVDWVYVELRDKNNISNVLYSTSALLQRDGDIVALDGVSTLTLAGLSDDYFISVTHRNHISIATNTIVSLSNTPTTIDLSQVSNIQGAGNAVKLINGVYVMFGGNFDRNSQIQNTDISGIRAILGISGYSDADFDMNGQVQVSELNNILRPNIGKGKQY